MLKKTDKERANFNQFSTGKNILSRIHKEKMTHKLILNINITKRQSQQKN